MPLDSTSSVVSFTMTMTDDTAHRIVEFDLPFYEVNIHIFDNNAKYGNVAVNDAQINTGDVVFFKNGNLKDFMFKNATAGSNTKIVAVATVPAHLVKQAVK